MKITIEIEVPDNSTHYFGDLRHSPTFLKKVNIGVVGAHWFEFNEEADTWTFLKHGDDPPHWAKELPKPRIN